MRRLTLVHREVRVDLFGKRFTVFFDVDGEPLRITTRKIIDGGKPWLSGWANVAYWHHSQGVGVGNTKPKQIIAAARAQEIVSE